MTIQTLPDFVGNNTAVVLAATGRAKRIWLTSLSAGTRVGDANTGAARGVDIVQNVPFVLSASNADETDFLFLNQVYVYVPTGSTLTVTYGT